MVAQVRSPCHHWRECCTSINQSINRMIHAEGSNSFNQPINPLLTIDFYWQYLLIKQSINRIVNHFAQYSHFHHQIILIFNGIRHEIFVRKTFFVYSFFSKTANFTRKRTRKMSTMTKMKRGREKRWKGQKFVVRVVFSADVSQGCEKNPYPFKLNHAQNGKKNRPTFSTPPHHTPFHTTPLYPTTIPIGEANFCFSSLP